jgi:hypothetical protein
MKRLLAIFILVMVAIIDATPAQAQGTGDYYYAESVPGTCGVFGAGVNLYETHICSRAETFVTYPQAAFLHSIRVSGAFAGPDYMVWDSNQRTIVLANPFTFRSIVTTPMYPYSKCAHSGWHDVRSTHSATLYGSVLNPGVPLWDHEQYSAILIPYCDCAMEIP